MFMPAADNSGVRIHFSDRGQGAPVLLLAGMSLDGHIWDDVVAHMPDGLRPIAVDNRGTGGSDVPAGPYSVPEMAADALAVLAELDIGTAVLVGHSLGGFLCQHLALERPEVVAGMVLVGTAHAGGREQLGSSPEVDKLLGRSRGPLEEIVRDSLAVCLGQRFLDEQPDRFDRLVADRVANPPRGRAVAGQRAAGQAFDARGRLGAVRCPTLVVQGDDDRVVPPARGRELAAAIPGAELRLLPGVGHLPQIEAPAELAAEIARLAGAAGVS